MLQIGVHVIPPRAEPVEYADLAANEDEPDPSDAQKTFQVDAS